METTLDKFGRVVIPKEIRDHLRLKPGETLQIEESEFKIHEGIVWINPPLTPLSQRGDGGIFKEENPRFTFDK